MSENSNDSRREFVKTAAVVAASLAVNDAGFPAIAKGASPMNLPPLPWADNALEPFISKNTIGFHYGKHHKTYLDNLNGLIAGKPEADLDLVAVVKGAVPRAAWPRRLHVATRTFQAIRIAVNDEMQVLTEALPQAASLLAPGGRFGVISFHSGEDRIVKRSFRTLSQEGGYVDLEPAPVEATADEILENPRARSAKLRVLERVAA